MLTLRQYYMLTLRETSVISNVTPAVVTNWQCHGLIDLLGHRVRLLPSFFSNGNRVLLDELSGILDSSQLGVLGCEYIQSRGQRNQWMSTVINLSKQPVVFVTGMVAPMHRYKWVCQQLLLSAPFDNEEEVLRQCDYMSVLSARGVLNPTEPHISLRKFVLEELVYWPIGYRFFWNRLRQSWAFFESHRSGLGQTYDLTLPVTESQLEDEQEAIYHKIVRIRQLAHSNVLSVLPKWEKDPLQRVESWLEQEECYALLKVICA